MDARDALVEQISTLFRGVMEPNLPDRFGLVARTMDGLEKTRRESGSAGEFGHALH